MTTLAFISLTSPLMLWGAAALALPVAAHLMNRRTRRRVLFPSVALLRDAAVARSRLFRFRRWLLLALRSLAVLLIALAFARPIGSAAPRAAATTSSNRGLVVVLDTSASVDQHPGGVSLFQQLRAAAQHALTAPAPPAAADVIFAAATPHPAFGRLVPNVQSLATEVLRAAPTAQRADLAAAIRRAAEELSSHTGPRHIVVLSDLQRTNWIDLLSGNLAHELAQQDIRITVEPIRPAAAPVNLAVTRPRVLPTQPLTGHPARFVAAVVNHAAVPRSVTVTLTLDGRPAGSRRVTLQPGESQDAAIDATVENPGEHRAVFEIPGDDFDADNRAMLVIDAVRRVPIVVISDADPRQPGSSSFYLVRALSPRGDGGDGLDARVIGSQQVTAAAFARAEAVVIGDAGRLSPAAAQALQHYIHSGGGVLMLCGPGPVADNTAALTAAAGSTTLLPWTPGVVRDSLVRITGGAWNSAALAAFDERAQDALAQVPFHQTHAATTPAKDFGGTTLLRFDDGTPALSEQSHGRGKLMLANFSTDPASGDLVKHGVFVALLHSLVQELRPTRHAQPAYTVGQAIRCPVAPAIQFTATDSAGRPVPIAVDTHWELPIVSIPPLTEPGFVTIYRDGQAARSVAMNVDERESDLRAINADEVNAALGGHAGDGRVNGEMVARGEASGGGGSVELWPWLVIGAMAAAATELAVLRWVKR